ncbi:MAG: hypothetical protein ACT4QF_01275 [Sporichthyaceae bacterium]
MIRDGLALPSEAVLVRALFDVGPDSHVFDRGVLIADATYNFEMFGYYGLSLWLVSESWPLERVLAEKCRRAGWVALFEAGELQRTGLGLVPSGKDFASMRRWTLSTFDSS